MLHAVLLGHEASNEIVSVALVIGKNNSNLELVCVDERRIRSEPLSEIIIITVKFLLLQYSSYSIPDD